MPILHKFRGILNIKTLVSVFEISPNSYSCNLHSIKLN